VDGKELRLDGSAERAAVWACGEPQTDAQQHRSGASRRCMALASHAGEAFTDAGCRASPSCSTPFRCYEHPRSASPLLTPTRSQAAARPASIGWRSSRRSQEVSCPATFTSWWTITSASAGRSRTCGATSRHGAAASSWRRPRAPAGGARSLRCGQGPGKIWVAKHGEPLER